MIVVYDNIGAVVQTVIMSQVSEEVMMARFKEVGQNSAHTDLEIHDITQYYFPGGIETKRPLFVVQGEVRPIKADNIDKVVLRLTPSIFDVYVRLNGIVIHQEHVEDGVIEFSSIHEGTYDIIVDAGFPIVPEMFEIKVGS